MTKNKLSLGYARNEFEETDEAKKNISVLTLEKNAFIDEGDGLIRFKNGLVITDDTEQRNGTRYDIKSMDLSEYSSKLTADHSRSIKDIIGKVIGTRKIANRKVVIEAIQLAIKENALAILAYDLLKGGYATDFSIETFGPWPNDDGVYENSKLIGLSLVVVGNNRSATTNKVTMQSIDRAKKLGLDTTLVENNYLVYDEVEAHTQSIKNKETKNMSDAVTPVVETPAVEAPVAETPKVEEKKSEPTAEVKEALKQVAEMSAKIQTMEKQIFDNAATEPGFRKASGKVVSELNGMDYKERHGKQILAAWNYLKNGSMSDQKVLHDINSIHLEKLQESGIVPNSMTLTDFGNFVISPELLKDIEGHRSDFTSLISKLDWRETLSLQMSYLTRSGDISMQEVETCDDDADGNLKPISEYGASITTSNLHELAAVTPVCNAATRFLAADLLGDAAAGYRNDYDRKRAQLAIARFQQAINTTGNTIVYGTTSDTNAVKSFIDAWSLAAEEIMNGTFIFSAATYGELVRRLVGAGISGPLAGVFTTGDQPMILGRPYIVVPNELLPTLNTATTKTFVVEGANVTINQAVIYADLSTFTGRTSGGLQYDLSTEAAYEDNDVVKSAFQRNELVLRGSFFRGGAVRDAEKVVGLGAPGLS